MGEWSIDAYDAGIGERLRQRALAIVDRSHMGLQAAGLGILERFSSFEL
jgi:hypothetical protein